MTNAPDTPDYAQQLAALRARFVAGLPARHDELTAAWQAWQGAADTPGADRARAVLAIALHRLAGAALSYGYDALGQHARTIEAHITAHEATPDAWLTEFTGLATALAALASPASAAPPAAP